MNNVGLILEGGGMRGMFTAGVLDYFLESSMQFPMVVGVSAGACHGSSFIAKQMYRNRDIVLEFICDGRYCGIKNLITTGNLFGEDFAYHQIPDKHIPFDYDAFKNSKTKFYSVISNIETGEAEYPQLRDIKTDVDYMRASASLPFVSRKVELDNQYYLDGGIVDAIPLKFSEEQGYDKNIVILTRPKGYRKTVKKRGSLIATLFYHKYPRFLEKMATRSQRYNEMLDYIEAQEEKGNVLVLRPDSKLKLKRIEKDKDKLQAAYEMGYDYAKADSAKVTNFLGLQCNE